MTMLNTRTARRSFSTRCSPAPNASQVPLDATPMMPNSAAMTMTSTETVRPLRRSRSRRPPSPRPWGSPLESGGLQDPIGGRGFRHPRRTASPLRSPMRGRADTRRRRTSAPNEERPVSKIAPSEADDQHHRREPEDDADEVRRPCGSQNSARRHQHHVVRTGVNKVTMQKSASATADPLQRALSS